MKIISMTKMPVIALLFLAAMTPEASAENRGDLGTGNGFYANCRDDSNTGFQSGACYGYLLGLYEASNFYLRLNPIYCVPSGTTNGQMYDLFINYLQRNPAMRHLPTHWLYSMTLVEAFPCPPK